MTKDHKDVWKCPQCVCKIPKIGNVNTPLSSAHSSKTITYAEELNETFPASGDVKTSIDSPSGSSEYINTKRGSRIHVLDQSLLEDTYCLDNIRLIMREELQRALDERLPSLISKTVRELTAPMAQEITVLTQNIASLESRLRTVETKLAGSMNKTLPVRHKPIDPPLSAAQNSQEESVSTRTPAKTDSHGPLLSQTEGGWTEVTKKPARASRVTRGTASPGSTQLEPSERRRYVHLFYVKVGTTEAQVREHLTSVFGADVCTVEVLRPRGNYASFKLSVPSKLADTVMSPSNWAEDICVKPWRQNFRPKPKEN
ncbi:hypothetical protein ABMA28_010666 [Loxostege sticticalis]|uniref:RRM domain-containing protein n=1 Tax=Loxostege sticticalis TaxID=481309 RepID=A0ABD0SA18_LOXSC